MKATPILTLPLRPWRLIPGDNGVAIEVRDGARQSLDVYPVDYGAALQAHRDGSVYQPHSISLPWKAAVTTITEKAIEWVEYDATGMAAKGPAIEIISSIGEGTIEGIVEPTIYQQGEEGYPDLATLIETLGGKALKGPIEYLEWGAAFVLCFYLWTENGAERWLWLVDENGNLVCQCLTQRLQAIPAYTPGPYLFQPPFLSVLQEPQTYQLFHLET